MSRRLRQSGIASGTSIAHLSLNMVARFCSSMAMALCAALRVLSRRPSVAIENYEKFLDLWKAADKDLPELIDAKPRLAKLKGVATR